MTEFRWPKRSQQVTIIGRNGSGKTRMGAWLLANASIAKRPWIIIDYKGEALFRSIGKDRITRLDLGAKVPTRPGLYHLRPTLHAADQEAVDDFLWRCWEYCNKKADRGTSRGIGIFADEGMRLQGSGAIETICTTGRSLNMPRIILVQRPIKVAREVFSEANFYCIFRLNDRRDRKTLDEFLPEGLAYRETEPYYSLWYDVDRDQTFELTPCPADDHILACLRTRAPVPWWRR